MIYFYYLLAWTDTDDTETTKESEDVSKQAKSSSDSSEINKGSLISVREAPDAVPSDVITNPMTTDTDLPYGTETDSMVSLDSTGTRKRIKRNTVVPTDGEETSGRQTPDSELKKGTMHLSSYRCNWESAQALKLC